MTNTRINLSKKYMYINDGNNLKELSLEDRVYFTLRDMFFNTNNLELRKNINKINLKLTNDTYLEERDENFKYSNALDIKEYVSSIIYMLERYSLEYAFNPEHFFFENNDKFEFMLYEDWHEQMKVLLITLKGKVESM